VVNGHNSGIYGADTKCYGQTEGRTKGIPKIISSFCGEGLKRCICVYKNVLNNNQNLYFQIDLNTGQTWCMTIFATHVKKTNLQNSIVFARTVLSQGRTKGIPKIISSFVVRD